MKSELRVFETKKENYFKFNISNFDKKTNKNMQSKHFDEKDIESNILTILILREGLWSKKIW